MPVIGFAIFNTQYNINKPTPKTENLSTEFYTLSIPFDILFKSDRISNFRFYAFCGGYWGYNFTSNEKASKNQQIIKLGTHNWGATLGVGFQFYSEYNIMTIEIKTHIGLNNVLIKDNANNNFSNRLDNLKTQIFSLGIIFH